MGRRYFAELDMQDRRLLPAWVAWIALMGILAVAGAEPTSAHPLAFICFFDRGSAQATDRCKQIAREMADWWRSHGKGQVELQAYAPDAAGGPEASRQLSLQRALTVARELASAGVSDERITFVGFGDETRLVPGEPLDPQNRLVWMVLH